MKRRPIKQIGGYRLSLYSVASSDGSMSQQVDPSCFFRKVYVRSYFDE